MAYGSGDVIREYAEDAEKLDAKVTEAKELLNLCKMFITKGIGPLDIAKDEMLGFAKDLLFRQIDDYVSWKG